MKIFGIEIRYAYIKAGEFLNTYNADGSARGHYRVRIQGFGKYAAVFPRDEPYGAIRRDGIRRGFSGQWEYHYSG